MPILIEEYALAWSPVDGAAYQFRLVGHNWSGWIKVSAADLAVLAAIFNETPIYFHPADKSIRTSMEPTGF